LRVSLKYKNSSPFLARKGARGMVEGYFGNLLGKGVGTETEGPRCTPTNSELNIPDLDDATLA
jgi:hypothetical protein